MVGPGSASGSTPVKGARYIDGNPFSGQIVRLVVTKTGRFLDPSGSYVDTNYFHENDCGVLQRIGTRNRRVRVRSNGSFRSVRRIGRFALRVRGRFLTPNLARVVYRYRRDVRRKGHPCDDTGTTVLKPRRLHRIPFHDCATHPARTLLLGATGRIFLQLEWDTSGGAWRTVAYGCLFATNKRIHLGDDDLLGDYDLLSLFRLAGPYVAYDEITSTGAAGSNTLVVVDLQNGKRSDPLGAFPTDIVLKDNGSVGWIAAESQLIKQPRSVWADDTTGHRQLDSGNGIKLDSLELNGSTLNWVKDGVVRSATLQ